MYIVCWKLIKYDMFKNRIEYEYYASSKKTIDKEEIKTNY